MSSQYKTFCQIVIGFKSLQDSSECGGGTMVVGYMVLYLRIFDSGGVMGS